MAKPTVGIFGLTGCAGDQLVLLDCEDELLDVVGLVDLRDFTMASSARDANCALDLAFVEGAVVTAEDERILRVVRERARLLVAIGTCAIWGGVPCMPGQSPRAEMLERVYGPAGAKFQLVTPRPLRDFVAVDAEITGCPIEKRELLGALASLLRGDAPPIPTQPVCAECRIRENRCLLVADGMLCCGPLTAAGCGARCPSLGVTCIGCRGPAPDANLESATQLFEAKGYSRAEIDGRLATFASAGRGGRG